MTPDDPAARPDSAPAPARRLFEPDARWRDALSAHRDALAEGLARRAAALGVEVRLVQAMVPFVITGTCDGTAFYLRERHGHYDVTVADGPVDGELWGAPADVATCDIASGDAAEFEDTDDPAGTALSLAVRAVRAHHAATAPHRDAPHRDAPHQTAPHQGIPRGLRGH